MGISRLSQKKIGRPRGYQYPVGLSFGVTGGVAVVNAAASTTGGDRAVDTVNNFTTHTYTTSGTFDPSFTGPVKYLVIGGGASGAPMGAGGGAGGFREGFIEVSSTQTYNVTVGGGGASVSRADNTPGANGTNSSFATIISSGGGFGGSRAPGG